MNAFEWHNATNVNEAVQLLKSAATGGDIDDAPRPIAGGQDILTTMKDYLTRPARLVNLKTIRGLNRIEVSGKTGLGVWARGDPSGVAQKPHPLPHFPLLPPPPPSVSPSFSGAAESAHSVGTPQIRNLGTIGGNLCQRPRCWYFRLEEAVCLKKGGTECFSYSGENKYNAIFGGGPSYIVHPSDLAP